MPKSGPDAAPQYRSPPTICTTRVFKTSCCTCASAPPGPKYRVPVPLDATQKLFVPSLVADRIASVLKFVPQVKKLIEPDESMAATARCTFVDCEFATF